MLQFLRLIHERRNTLTPCLCISLPLPYANTMFNRPQDVIILFYDLKRSVFKNIFEGAANQFPSSSVVFAQYDCHKHDPPKPFADIHHQKVHYPAIYFYRRGAEPEHYKGLRMQVSIIEWIKNHPHIKHASL